MNICNSRWGLFRVAAGSRPGTVTAIGTHSRPHLRHQKCYINTFFTEAVWVS